MAYLKYTDARIDAIKREIENATRALALLSKPKDVDKAWYDKQKHDIIGGLNLVTSRLDDVRYYIRGAQART